VDAHESFQAYVRARSAALARVAYLLTGDRHAAEDLVQEALIRVAGRWPRVVAQGDPDPYVRRVLYHQHVSLWRRSRHRPMPVPDLPEAVTPDPAGALTRALTVRAALARLTPKQRAVLVLRYFEDRSEAEAAQLLSCSVGTIKSQTSKALARLRQIAPDLLAPAPTEGAAR
jgi:RNA polymerase sigma-70 factor (sigma-E family)